MCMSLGTPTISQQIVSYTGLQNILGSRYAEVVRKCIHCDFGHGCDLGKTRLQERFLQDVICELEELGDKLRRLGLRS